MRVELDYLYGADSRVAAARLRCGISRGTFPRVSWLLNASVLPSETNTDARTQPLLRSYALANSGRTLLVTSLGPEESGFYRCRARDSYDDAGPWVESKAILVQVSGDDTNCEMILKKKQFLQETFHLRAAIALPSCIHLFSSIYLGLILNSSDPDSFHVSLCPFPNDTWRCLLTHTAPHSWPAAASPTADHPSKQCTFDIQELSRLAPQ